ncbi:GntR family transcriptional regulator [Marinicella sp. W31]|uniref:GntR family transcriptional regulator n=1 Tax=Marinicella sp. W31 TaxID=3023713 RepID=UPI003756D13F
MSFHWNDKEPIYIQLKDMIREMILKGELKTGEALPSVRQIAAEYQLNPITVSKSWQLLADEELVEKRRGLGMFVTENAQQKVTSEVQQKFIENDWPDILRTIQQLNLDIQPLIKSLEEIGS